MASVAAVCPVSKTEFFLPQTFPARLPGIPAATDLPSLIRTVNLITDVLISLTGSLTVNNVYNPAAPPTINGNSRIGGNIKYSPYPEWQQVSLLTATGYVYNKTRQGMDKSQRAYVKRTNVVEFQNIVQRDPDFFWRYALRLDGMA